MNRKTILITGATDGIGRTTAMRLAEMGHRVIIHGRNVSKAEATVLDIKRKSGNQNVDYLIADLFSLASVKSMALTFNSHYNHLDVLINNAGAVLDDQIRITTDHIETTLQLNVIAPLLLTELLLPSLQRSNDGRIINMASATVRIARPRMDDLSLQSIASGQQRYAISKLFVIWNTQFLAQKLKKKGINNVTVNVSHPGAVATNFGQDSDNGLINNLIYKLALRLHLMASPDAGANTNIYLATSDDVKGISGCYFNNHRKQITPPQRYYSINNQEKVWDYCQKQIQKDL
ncbi:SDR family NAD(P)-dependent oxidoreductase [Nicoliella lavandulae]|uniref:SDR family NAD(P)-dependent oxidoreductase n=1 Tax=Nicoliella lavandulae TaxID=3082954 RepID=A0ABU8SN30_9LACO